MDEDSSHIDRLTRWVLFDTVDDTILVFDTNSYKKKRYTKKKYGYHREVCTHINSYYNIMLHDIRVRMWQWMKLAKIFSKTETLRMM